MLQSEERYISLLTDFGFKRIFGTELNKDLLINFLNSLFEGEQVITDVRYLNSEHVGDVYSERKAIFDVYCENERGERFIVEMQNAFQQYFKDRSLFYSTFPIREQAPKMSEWNFKLEHVYVIALLNFDMKEESFSPEKICHDVTLRDGDTHRVFIDKLRFKYVEIAKFNKTENELVTLFDKWLFVLRNLSRLDNQPAALKEKVFSRVFKASEIARFTPSEYHEYEDSLKAYRDLKNSLDTALMQGEEKGRAEGLEEGLAKGRAEGRAEERMKLAKSMLAQGIPVETVMKITELDADEIISNFRE